MQKLCLFFKQGSLLLLKNYRPIGLLCAFSKILEKAVHIRMLFFFNTNNALSTSQIGFRPNYSTSAVCTYFINCINNNHFKSNKSAVAIFLDMSKAFDTLDHSVLLKKCFNYGFRGMS